jgi:double-stranded uracil-DNA glycosylase
MDRATVEIYERIAAVYDDRRPPRQSGLAEDFDQKVVAGGVRADLGCGPGRYTAFIGRPVIALDAARAMLELVPGKAPDALRVQADLAALPLRRAALAGAWANLSYQHVPRFQLPLALARLHDALVPGAPISVALFEGTGEGPLDDDEFPGRTFVRWQADDLEPLFTAAGFEVEAIDGGSGGGVSGGRRPGMDALPVRVTATRARTLPDIVGPDMRLLICGLNPSLYAADAGVNFARPGNRFWPAALASGLVSHDRDPWHALAHHGIGFTDIVKTATPRADSLRADDYRRGLERLSWTVRLLRPGAVCFVGLAGVRAALDPRAVAGPREGGFAGAPAYVMPNTSGLNAHASPADFRRHLQAAAALA